MNINDVINILIKHESITKQILIAIKKLYGRKFIDDVLNDTKKEKKKRHTTKQIITYYNTKLKEYPEKQKLEIRKMTALHFDITTKAVEYHITKSNS